MDVMKQFAFDKEASEQGKWFQLGPEARIKMRSLNSAHSRAVRTKLEAPYKTILNAGQDLPKDVAEQMLKDQFVESLIIEWEGLTANDEPMPYSKANAIKLMTDAEGFVDFLVKILMSNDSFAPIAEEDEVKN